MMNKSFLILCMLFNFSVPIFAQNRDTLQAKKDSVVHVIPIPELGSIEPFGDSLKFISEKQITYKEYRSLYDIIAGEPGVFIRDLSSAGQQNQIIINGIDDRNIAVMVDGIPYNDHYTGSVNLWNIPVDAVERVELITGAGGMFYDGTSGGGVINIVTKNFNNNRAVTRLRYSQGISGYTHTDAMFAQNVANGLNLSFALSHYGFGSNKGSVNYRGRFDNSNDDAWMIRSKLRYNVTQWMNLIFSYSFDRKWTGLNGGVDYSSTISIFDGLKATVQNEESYQKDFNSNYNLTAAFSPSQDSSTLASFSIYSFDRLREYRDEENRDVALNTIFTKRDFASVGKGLKVNVLSQFSGYRFIGYADLARIQPTDIISAGLKGEIRANTFLTLSPFLTVKDYQSQFIENGGIEGTLQVSSSMSLFGGVAQNFINDRSIIVSASSVPGSAESFSASERWKETFSIAEIGGRWNIHPDALFSLSYKRIVRNHPVVFDTVSVTSSLSNYDYFHPDKYMFNSITGSINLQWNDFHFDGTGNYVRYPTIKRYNVPITLFPEITANGSVYFQGLLAKGHLDLKIGLRGNYFSSQTGMRPYDEFGVWIPSTELKYGPSSTLDFFAIGKIGDAYVHLIWENLTGSRYLLAPVYPMYDRNIRFGVSWEFLD